MQNENTILINECNRLRKNLHEIYLHVIDIEQRFEKLTKIDPTLSKSQIVKQIKDFIKKTHEKIKENYSKKNYNNFNEKINIANNITNRKAPNKRYIAPLNKLGMNRNRSTNNINSSYFDNKKIVEVVGQEELQNQMNDINKGNEEGNNSNFYANIIQRPKKLKKAESFINPKNNNNINHSIAVSIKRGKIKLPSILK